MKATGIIRRIDDLGRIVIPREIRNTLRIREGDPLEVYTGNEGEVVFKKYHPLGELQPFATEYAASLSEATGISIFICNRDEVIAVSGASKRDYLNKRVSDQLTTIMEERIFFSNKQKPNAVLIVDDNPFYVQCAMPIISEGEVIGCVISGITGSEGTIKVSLETVETMIKTSALFLGKQTTRIW